jgi:DNA adenine methylase
MPKTPITYYGGKVNMLQHILPNIPAHKVYVEPFFGGGAVFFAKEKSQSEIINDLNSFVINFYEVCISDFDNLKAKIEATIFARATYSVANSIYRMPHLFSKLQQAWAFYIATNMGFGCRIGSWGFDKYGKRAKAFLNKKLRFDDSIFERLKTAQVENSDAIKIVDLYDVPDAWFYVDPPYINSHMGHYAGYSENDYRQLLERLSLIKGKFLLSSYPSDILEEFILKNGWFIKHFDKPLTAKKGVLGKARDKRKTEVLVANYPLC